MKIPFLNFEPMHREIQAEMQEAFQRVYSSNWFILGNEVSNFESNYAHANNVSHCIGVSNGLDALVLALKTCGVSEGDEVIIPSNTYIATMLAVSYVGAKPVFVEPRMETYNLNPELLTRSITNNTKAIIPVHLYGQPCEMDTIMDIANAAGLNVIEDNAQAHLSSYKGKLTGSWGLINATSFYPGKNLGALGDAGAITTDSIELAERVRIYRNYGSQIKYKNELMGYNMRLDEIQAAFLDVKLNHLEKWNEQRAEIARNYYKLLFGIGDIILPYNHPDSIHTYHLFVIRTKYRNHLKEYLDKSGVGTLIHYPIPPHLQKASKKLNYPIGSLPIAEEISNTCLSLPIWPGLNFENQVIIAETINDFFKA